MPYWMFLFPCLSSLYDWLPLKNWIPLPDLQTRVPSVFDTQSRLIFIPQWEGIKSKISLGVNGGDGQEKPNSMRKLMKLSRHKGKKAVTLGDEMEH